MTLNKTIIIIMILCLILTACNNNEMVDMKISNFTNYSSIDNIDSVLLAINQTDYKYDVKFEIQNNSNKKITWGNKWYLEQYKNDEWYTIEFKEQSAWEDYSISLNPNEKKIVQVSLQNYFDLPLDNGTYRLIQVINGHILYTVFEVSINSNERF